MRRAPEKVKVEVADTSFSQMKHADIFWRENHSAAVQQSEYFFLKKIFEKICLIFSRYFVFSLNLSMACNPEAT